MPLPKKVSKELTLPEELRIIYYKRKKAHELLLECDIELDNLLTKLYVKRLLHPKRSKSPSKKK